MNFLLTRVLMIVLVPPLILMHSAVQQASPDQASRSGHNTKQDAFVRQVMDNAGMPGLQAVVVKDGKIVWSGAYGNAVVDVPGPRRPMRHDSLILIASTSKILVAIAVLQQMEKGRLSLDEDINKYLPFSARNPHWPDIPITWRMLLTHTSSLQDALGQIFVEQSFHEIDKQRVLKIVRETETTFDGLIQNADWLSPATRDLALVKLHAVTNRVGYPEHWRNYSSLATTRDSWTRNAFRSSEYELSRQLDHIGKPPDRNEWWMTVTALDAYNNVRQNSLTFPAGWLAPPLFDRSAEDSVNFGALGSVAGHEVTHGFDSMGRKYDASGELREWWTADDTRRFEDRAKCLVDQYSNYVAVDNVKVNGELTLAENIADETGTRLAYRRSTAWQDNRW